MIYWPTSKESWKDGGVSRPPNAFWAQRKTHDSHNDNERRNRFGLVDKIPVPQVLGLVVKVTNIFSPPIPEKGECHQTGSSYRLVTLLPSIFPQIALAIGVLTSSIGVRVRRLFGFFFGGGPAPRFVKSQRSVKSTCWHTTHCLSFQLRFHSPSAWTPMKSVIHILISKF